MKKNYRLLYLITIFSAYSGLFSMEEPQQNWVFIKNMPGAADKEDRDVDWRIKNQKLELNLDATEIITQQTFAEIIKEAKDKNLPFILVKVQSGDKGQYTHFFDGNIIIRTIMSNLKKTNILTNPVNKQEIINIEIYVAGDDGKLRLLKDNVDAKYLVNFVNFKGATEELTGGTYVLTYEYVLVPELLIPGIAQAYIAKLYKEQFLKMVQEDRRKKVNIKDLFEKAEVAESLRKQVRNLRAQLTLLQQQKNTAISATESESLSTQINNIEMEINNLVSQIKRLEDKDPQIEKLQQLERLWLSWSLDKFSAKDDFEKQKAHSAMSEIEYKPQYLQD